MCKSLLLNLNGLTANFIKDFKSKDVNGDQGKLENKAKVNVGESIGTLKHWHVLTWGQFHKCQTLYYKIPKNDEVFCAQFC